MQKLPLAFTFFAIALAAPLPKIPSPTAYQASSESEIVPAPREAKYSTGTLSLDHLSIRIEGTAPELQWAARDLNLEIKNRLNKTLSIGTQGLASQPQIRIGTLQSPDLANQAKERNLTPDKTEGYALWVDAKGAAVVGFDALGAYRGVQTLRQLLTPKSEVAFGRTGCRAERGLICSDAPTGFGFAQIRDWPEFPLRMAMIYLDKDSKPTNDALIPLLAKYKYSHLLVMSNYVQWTSARDLWHPSGATRAEAERVVKLIREHGMEPIPLLELLGHAQWLFYNARSGKYDGNKDLWADPEAQNPYAYDPLVPRTYEVVLPILSEAVEVFRPKFVHIGHDEVAANNRFPAKPEGIALGLPKLFVQDTLRLYNHLKSLGANTMIWHDVALSDAHRDSIAPQLPKDITITYWNYSPAEDYPLIRKGKELGFSMIGSSWFASGNPESMTKVSQREAASGVLQTRWSGYFGNPSFFDGQAEQGISYITAANVFWNPASPPPSNAALRYRDGWRPSSFVPIAGQLVNLSSAATRKLTDPDETQWIQKGPSTDLSKLPTGVQRFGPYQFHISGAVMLKGNRPSTRELPEKVVLEIGAKARAIAVLHTSAFLSTIRAEKIGAYVLGFADGSSLRRELEYGRNITGWLETNIKTLIYSPAWSGKTGDELDVQLNSWVMVNPKPDLTIQSITFEGAGLGANPVLLGLTLLDQVPAEAR